jgi:hypothetical protein
MVDQSSKSGACLPKPYTYSNCKAEWLMQLASMAWKMAAEAFEVDRDVVFLQFSWFESPEWAKISLKVKM